MKGSINYDEQGNERTIKTLIQLFFLFAFAIDQTHLIFFQYTATLDWYKITRFNCFLNSLLIIVNATLHLPILLIFFVFAEMPTCQPINV